MEEVLVFTNEEGQEYEFAIIEETRINGVNYILVAEMGEDEEADAYILKDVSNDEDEEAIYEMVDDESEVSYIGKIFAELCSEMDIEV